jgi:hypothetical protein
MKAEQKQYVVQLKKSGTAVADKSSSARPPLEGAATEKKRKKKMNGLIKTSLLGNIGSFGALVVAFGSLSAVLYVMVAGAGLV